MYSTLQAGATVAHRGKDKTKLETLIRIGQIPLRFNGRGKRTLTSDSGRYKKSQMKLWPEFTAAFNQIQFADQDFRSNSTGKPLISRVSIMTAAQKSRFTLSPRTEEESIKAPS